MAKELSADVGKWLFGREPGGSYNQDAIDLANNLAVARIYQYVHADSAISPNVERKDRTGTRPSFGSSRGITLRRNLGVAIRGDVVAANNPGSPGGEYPYGMSDCMVAAGMAETIVASTSATYAPKTEAGEALTVYHWERFLDAAQTWQLIYATGVRGNFSMEASGPGEIATWAFDGESANFPFDSGVTANPHGYSVDLAFFDADGTIALDKNGAAIVYTGLESVDDPTPMYFEAGTVTIDGTNFEVDNFKINHNNRVTIRMAGTANPYVEAVLITQRLPTLEVGLVTTGAGFKKAIDKALDNAEMSGSLVLTDRMGTGGSTLTIACPKLQANFATRRDIEGLRGWTLPLAANGNWAAAQVGDNEISYAWTVTA